MRLYPEATKKFVQESGTCRTPASVKTMATQLRLLQNAYPALTLDQFRTHHVTAWCLSTIRSAPSPGTIRARASVAKSFFSWCVWQKLIEHSPAEDLKWTVRPGHNKVRHGHWLSEAELAKLVRALPSTLRGKRDKVVILLGAMMGLRNHELVLLSWSQFSNDYSRLTFIGKGQKLAQLGVPPQVGAVLRSWRKDCPVGPDVVFPTMYGPFGTPNWSQRLGAAGICDLVSDAGAQIGVELRTHDLRRTFAGILEAKGVAVKDISRLMRHSNVGTTDTYLEEAPGRAAALAEQFELAL